LDFGFWILDFRLRNDPLVSVAHPLISVDFLQKSGNRQQATGNRQQWEELEFFGIKLI
jgi:hypothetical protein